jgi:hypothetical protein
MTSVAIHQPNFIPWIGYFHKIKQVDQFVFLDNVQYVKQSPASRNYIKDKKGEKFLLVLPVKKKNYTTKNYNEIEIDYAQNWQKKHLNKIKDSYFHAPSFEETFNFIDHLYSIKYANLAELNIYLIKEICKLINLKTNLLISSSININANATKNLRNIEICKNLNATHYVSGIGAKKYNQEELYSQHKIQLTYQNYTPIIYPQINGSFLSNLSVLDYLFNVAKSEYGKLFQQ